MKITLLPFPQKTMAHVFLFFINCVTTLIRDNKTKKKKKWDKKGGKHRFRHCGKTLITRTRPMRIFSIKRTRFLFFFLSLSFSVKKKK